MEKILFKKGIALMIIVLFIWISFTSVTAIKSNILETKIKPASSFSGKDVYYDCEIITDGYADGRALLFPGYFQSIFEPGKQGRKDVSGILLKVRSPGDDDPVIIDGNSYYNDDWDLMIVSHYGGLFDNTGGSQGPIFYLEGNASRVVVYDLF